ncbi:hypothetical protein EK21DRAFT_116101 [Setomelanomma holmii]|uniref:Uncharacterized protein n=1 Tax=Setomelanomma holmii TaxID=210430 RepID=A0A9P4H1W5_9PLEO|nr:hypothetical protein EK21DRAFT_116101 [Setomelanomma holmii]
MLDLFLNREPKCHVIGLHLTKHNIERFLATTTTVLDILAQQLAAIRLLHYHDPTFRRNLKGIQERQYRSQNAMKLLIEATRPSTELWLREIDDGQQAVLRKIKWCNRMSLPQNLGIKNAVLRYWPMIGTSYREVCIPNLEKLKTELETCLANERTWKVQRGPNSVRKTKLIQKPNRKGKNVYLLKDVRARWIPGLQQTLDEAAERKFPDFTVPLTTDRKRTAGRFKKSESARSVRSGNSGSVSDIESEYERTKRAGG